MVDTTFNGISTSKNILVINGTYLPLSGTFQRNTISGYTGAFSLINATAQTAIITDNTISNVVVTTDVFSLIILGGLISNNTFSGVACGDSNDVILADSGAYSDSYITQQVLKRRFS